MAKKTCSLEGCDRKHYGKTYCINHYMVWKRNGSPIPTYGKTHGMSKSPEYMIWQNMKARCYYPRDISYVNYGGRGIKVCDRWLNSFDNFIADMGKRPKGTSIERKNNDGDYSPENCVWLDRSLQNHNQRLRTDNKTGYRGVYLNKYGVYEAYLTVFGGKKTLYSKSLNEAVELRRELERGLDEF